MSVEIPAPSFYRARDAPREWWTERETSSQARARLSHRGTARLAGTSAGRRRR